MDSFSVMVARWYENRGSKKIVFYHIPNRYGGRCPMSADRFFCHTKKVCGAYRQSRRSLGFGSQDFLMKDSFRQNYLLCILFCQLPAALAVLSCIFGTGRMDSIPFCMRCPQAECWQKRQPVCLYCVTGTCCWHRRYLILPLVWRLVSDCTEKRITKWSIWQRWSSRRCWSFYWYISRFCCFIKKIAGCRVGECLMRLFIAENYLTYTALRPARPADMPRPSPHPAVSVLFPLPDTGRRWRGRRLLRRKDR